MPRTATLALVLSLLAASAQAQQYPGGRGGMGRGGDRGRGGNGESRGALPAPPTRADIEKQDPILVLISNQKALGLTGSEITALAGVDASVMEKTRPLLQQLDSLGALVKPDADASAGGANPNVDALLRILGAIRKNYDDATKDALAQLTDDQKPKAKKLIDEAGEKALNEARKKADHPRDGR